MTWNKYWNAQECQVLFWACCSLWPYFLCIYLTKCGQSLIEDASWLLINIYFYFQKDDITNCFTWFHAIFGYLELSLLKSLFICLFTFGSFWKLLKKAGKFDKPNLSSASSWIGLILKIYLRAVHIQGQFCNELLCSWLKKSWRMGSKTFCYLKRCGFTCVF